MAVICSYSRVVENACGNCVLYRDYKFVVLRAYRCKRRFPQTRYRGRDIVEVRDSKDGSHAG